MKRRSNIIIVYAVCVTSLLPLLSGCSSAFSNHRDIERILPVQTIGIDSIGSGISVAMSSGQGQEDSTALVISAAASDVEQALSRMQDYSPRDELYFAHVQYILVGSTLAENGLSEVLDWVERSPSMRMDTALFVVRDTAVQAVLDGSENDDEITQRMASLEREERSRGMEIYSLRQAATSLAEQDFALCMAVEALTEEGTVKTDGSPGCSIVPSGYAVLKDDRLAGYLTAEESLAVQLMNGDGRGSRIDVDNAVLEIFSGRCSVQPDETGDKQLTGITITAEVEANLLETASDVDPAAINDAFSQTVCTYIRNAVAASGKYDCDILHLAENAKYSWQTVRTVPVTVKVSGTVVRGLDAGTQEGA